MYWFYGRIPSPQIVESRIKWEIRNREQADVKISLARANVPEPPAPDLGLLRV